MMERKKFGAKGFNMMYPFSLGDLRDSSICLTNYLENASGALPWAALTAWGFADAPVSFGLTEHDHAPSGAEHDLVLVVLPGRIVLCFCLGAADRFQPERLRSGGVRHLY